MKAEMIKSVGNVLTNTVKASAKTESAVASKAVKNGEALMAAGQDAAAVQGRVMVKKPYVKPEIEVHKVEKQNLRAASGWDDGGYNPRGGYVEEDLSSSQRTWGNVWEDQGW